MTFEVRGSERILIAVECVVSTVELYRDARSSTGEVNDVALYHELAREAPPVLTQRYPQYPLFRRRLAPKAARIDPQLWRDALHRSFVADDPRVSTHLQTLPSREGSQLSASGQKRS